MLVLPLILSGCSVSSTIINHGPDTYLISVDDPSSAHSFGELQARAATEAEAHCSKQGKTMRAISISNSGSPGYTTTNASLSFTCISKQ
jgi:hypothetical protein